MGLVTTGILNMPLPDDPAEMDIITWVQIKHAMRDGAREIYLLRLAAAANCDLSKIDPAQQPDVQAALHRAKELS